MEVALAELTSLGHGELCGLATGNIDDAADVVNNCGCFGAGFEYGYRPGSATGTEVQDRRSVEAAVPHLEISPRGASVHCCERAFDQRHIEPGEIILDRRRGPGRS